MKTFAATVCAIVLSAMTMAQPSLAQGGGQTGNPGFNNRSGQTTGIGTSYPRAGRPYSTGGAEQVTGDPNGTAGGPTTLSGTGPSTYGGNNPGAAR